MTEPQVSREQRTTLNGSDWLMPKSQAGRQALSEYQPCFLFLQVSAFRNQLQKTGTGGSVSQAVQQF